MRSGCISLLSKLQSDIKLEKHMQKFHNSLISQICPHYSVPVPYGWIIRVAPGCMISMC